MPAPIPVPRCSWADLPDGGGSAAAVARTGASPAPECGIFVHQVAHPGPGSIVLRLKVGLGPLLGPHHFATPAKWRGAAAPGLSGAAVNCAVGRIAGLRRPARGVARRLPRCRGSRITMRRRIELGPRALRIVARVL